MCLDRRLAEGKTKPAPRTGRQLRRAIDLDEAIENALALIRWNTKSAVRDADLDFIQKPAVFDANDAIAKNVSYRILDEIFEHTLEQVAISANGLQPDSRFQSYAAGLCLCAECPHDLLHQRAPG